MTVTARRKLIEVALPLKEINEEGKRDKSLNRAHPKALHWWWARRPLAVCRAIIFAQLVDDPSSHPGRFPTEESQVAERERLFDLMRELVKWERSNDVALMREAGEEIARCFDGQPPAVIDPFCGGGSIPVEARRLGLRAVGHDLNPVAVLITKAMIELPALYGGKRPVRPNTATLDDTRTWSGSSGLAADVAHYGQVLIESVNGLSALYEDGPGDLEPGDSPVAWFWARTIRCPNPGCGGVIPLVNSFWLSRPSSSKAARLWAKPSPSQSGPWVDFEVVEGGDPPAATVSRRNITCVLCGGATTADFAKTEGAAGRMGRQLLAVCVISEGGKRTYRPSRLAPTVVPEPDSDIITESIPFHPQYLQLSRYGFTTFEQLFTLRQRQLLGGFVAALPKIREEIISDGASADYADAVLTYLAFFIDRVSTRNSAFSFWDVTTGKVQAATSTNYLPMRWVYAEANPFGRASGGMAGQLDFLVKSIASLPDGPNGSAIQRDATASPLENGAAFCTDPPYFDNVPYADLSDFFYVWLKRTVGRIYPDLFSTILTPKGPELVADSTRHGGREEAAEFFRRGFRKAFDVMTAASHPDVPIVVYYALRQQESDRGGSVVSTGWDAMLQSLVDAGLMITATWPSRTEQSGGLRSHGRNALASSVVIACRSRTEDAVIASARQFMQALRDDLPDSLRRLRQGNIPAVDFAQAAIGPGMAVFSQYAKVLEADGAVMTVRTALGLINEALDEVLAEQEGEFDADTRWAVAWFDQHGFGEGSYGEAENLSRAKNTSVGGMVEAGIVESRPGKVRLLRPDELAEDWDPVRDERLTVWESTHHLVRALDRGEAVAADLLRRLGGVAGAARDLAYRLYVVCERRELAQEGRAYDGLVQSWPEMQRLAAESANAHLQEQMEV
jgi:putative DNA methylase